MSDVKIYEMIAASPVITATVLDTIVPSIIVRCSPIGHEPAFRVVEIPRVETVAELRTIMMATIKSTLDDLEAKIIAGRPS